MNNTAHDVAATILAQLGGNRFLAMTGAKNLTSEPRALNMRIGRNGRGVTHVRVALRDDDTYRVAFLAVRGANVRVVADLDGVQVADLRATFEAQTELRTSL